VYQNFKNLRNLPNTIIAIIVDRVNVNPYTLYIVLSVASDVSNSIAIIKGSTKLPHRNIRIRPSIIAIYKLLDNTKAINNPMKK
jgi:hypothetical protein